METWYGAAYAERGARGGGPVDGVLALLNELREVTGESALAIEWAAKGDGSLVLLQVRALALPADTVTEADHHALLVGVEAAVRAAADWNAESA